MQPDMIGGVGSSRLDVSADGGPRTETEGNMAMDQSTRSTDDLANANDDQNADKELLKQGIIFGGIALLVVIVALVAV